MPRAADGQRRVRERPRPRAAALPTGNGWSYGTGLEVLGRLIEIVAGQRLDKFFTGRILEPLGMTDTDFAVPAERTASSSLCAGPADGQGRPGRRRRAAPDPRLSRPVFLGGGGLVSTMADHHRSATMLANRGVLDGQRLLGTRTVDYMARNHLPAAPTSASGGRSSGSAAKGSASDSACRWSTTRQHSVRLAREARTAGAAPPAPSSGSIRWKA